MNVVPAPVVAPTVVPRAHVQSQQFFVRMAYACAGLAIAGFVPTYWAPLATGSFVGPSILHLHGVLLVRRGRFCSSSRPGPPPPDTSIVIAHWAWLGLRAVFLGSCRHHEPRGQHRPRFEPRARAASIVPISIVLLALSTVAYAQDPNIGSWRVDLAKSKYNPADLAPKSVTVKSSAVGKGLNVVVDVVDNTGKSLHYEYTVTYDGQDVPVKGDPNRDTTAMKRIDELTFEQTNKKGGKVTTVSRLAYAKDGKSRTQTTTGVNPQGQKINNTVVWLKQ